METRNPKRTTRGVRVTELLGEDAENDEEFWNHETWAESESDGEYSSEEDKPDEFDSDFNDSESDDEVDSEEEEKKMRKSEKKSQAADRKRKATYKEPGPKKRPAKAPAGPAPADGGGTGSTPVAARLRIKAEALLPRSLRQSTTTKSKESEVQRKAEEKAWKARPKPKPIQHKCEFTQEELLTEAVQTERENTKWILSRQRAAREKEESNSGPKQQNLTAVKYISRRGTNPLITFADVESLPEFFRPGYTPPAPPERPKPVCVITGLPAKYLDPLTQQPYANAEAFKKLRERAKKKKARHLQQQQQQQQQQQKPPPASATAAPPPPPLPFAASASAPS